jgi:hypothetical protein
MNNQLLRCILTVTLVLAAATALPGSADAQKQKLLAPTKPLRELSPNSPPGSLPLTVQECLALGGKVELHEGCTTRVKCSTKIGGVARAICIDEGLVSR